MAERPSGTVTLLFTDVEGSTRLWEESPEATAEAIARHDEIIRGIVERQDGYVFSTSGDGFAVAFSRPHAAVTAAIEIQVALQAIETPLRVRMAIHMGVAEERDGDYFGPALNESGRLLSAAHGGQVLVSGAVRDVLGPGLREDMQAEDLGEHRFRDVGRPLRVFQVSVPETAAEFPRIRSLGDPHRDLPVQVTRFVGRDRELVELIKLLDTGRLVTLVGAGGCGKTRLAVETGSWLLTEGVERVWFTDLSGVSDGDLVLPVVAEALGLDALGEDPLRRLLDGSRSREGVLVIDNCEHLLEAVSRLVAGLLREASGIRVLATSREPLRVQGEAIWPVEPLGVPPADVSPEDLLRFESVRLFEDRAALVSPGFEVSDQNAEAVGRICRRLDGIPLAVELAAARLRMMSPSEIADRLDRSLGTLGSAGVDVATHHRTLDAALDWSHDLLERSERLLFARLAVFAGGWTLNAVESIAGDDMIPRAEILGILGSLVDKSLVTVVDRSGMSRYRFLEPVREYALGKQRQLPDTEVLARRHAEYYAALAEEAFPELWGPDEDQWVDRLEPEVDNLRAALAWHLDNEFAQAAQLMAGALYRFWWRTHRRNEALRWRDQVVAADDSSSHGLARALLIGSGLDGWRVDEIVDLYREHGPEWELAIALNNSGVAARARGDLERAADLHEEALELTRSSGTESGLEAANLASVKFTQGAITEAEALFDEALDAARRNGSPTMLRFVLQLASWFESERGNFNAARTLAREGLEIELRPGVRTLSVGLSTISLAWIAIGEGNLSEAVSFLEFLYDQLDGLDYGEPEAIDAGEAESLIVRAVLEIAAGRHRSGAVLIGADAQFREAFNSPVLEVGSFGEAIAAARDEAKTVLGAENYESALEEGAAMALKDALRYARKCPPVEG